MSKTELRIVEANERQATVAPTEDNYEASLERKGMQEGTLDIISFFIGPLECAFEVSDAVEVLRSRKVTEVPLTPAYIKGILSVRGEMVPVIDLKVRLGELSGAEGPAARILITVVDDLKVGFVVDRLNGVREVPESSVLLPDGSEPHVAFMKAVILDGEKTIMLLDVRALADIAWIE